MMGDIDIYVAPDQFDKAVSLILANGFSFASDPGYHVGVTSEQLDIDIHRYIYKNGGDIGSDIYSSAIPCSFLGCDVYVLSPENMLLHQLANRSRDICDLSHTQRHFKWIVDCYYIMNFCSPDVGTLLNKAKELDNLYYVQFTLEKFAELFPDFFKDEAIRKNDKTYANWLKAIVVKTKTAKRFEGKTVKGLRYVFSYRFGMRMKTAKIDKYAAGSKKSALRITFENEKIYTLKDLLPRLRRVFRNSKNGSVGGRE